MRQHQHKLRLALKACTWSPLWPAGALILSLGLGACWGASSETQTTDAIVGSLGDVLGAEQDGHLGAVGDADRNIKDGLSSEVDVWIPSASSEVSTAPPDPRIAKQPLGGICVTALDCRDDYCNDTYPAGYCSKLCEAHTDCPDAGKCFEDPNTGAKMCWKRCTDPADCRLDQFCARGASICTPKCEEGSCQPGYACDSEVGECVPQDELTPCVPTDELCDGVDNDCDLVIDEGCGPAPANGANVNVIDLGLVSVGGGGLATRKFTVSSAAVSFTIVVSNADGSDDALFAYGLESPTGAALIDLNDPYGGLFRVTPAIGALTVLYPNTPSLEMVPGRYEFSVYRDGQVGEAWMYVIQNIRGQTQSSEIDVNFWFVGTPNLSASTAPNKNKFKKLQTIFVELLASYGISTGQITYLDVEGVDAQRYTWVDTSDGLEVDEHAELIALSRDLPEDNQGVNIFFVQGFNGWSLLGKAGSIPGPPLLQGRWTSGVVVSLTDYYNYDADIGPQLTAETMMHELGHQLGLYHTSEQSGTAHDPIADTPECSVDINGDGIVDLEECEGRGASNIMFWSATFATDLSAGQRFVVHRNPQLGEL